MKVLVIQTSSGVGEGVVELTGDQILQLYCMGTTVELKPAIPLLTDIIPTSTHPCSAAIEARASELWPRPREQRTVSSSSAGIINSLRRLFELSVWRQLT